MKQVLDLYSRVLAGGSERENRTGVDDLFLPGDMLKFDMADGFPIMTTRPSPFKSPIGEMRCFINGETNAEVFAQHKCKYWFDNANDPGLPGHENVWLKSPYRKGENDLGEIYGVQWRRWLMEGGEYYDQFAEAIKAIQTNPNSRRIIVNAWRPDRFNRMALPPCHVMHQWVCDVKKKELHLNMFIRSNDLFLGLPSNVVQYAWLLCAVAHATGYTPRMLGYMVGDAHLYVDSHQAAREQIGREPRALPKLVFKKPYDGSVSVLEWLENTHPDDYELDGYNAHPPLESPMPKMAV